MTAITLSLFLMLLALLLPPEVTEAATLRWTDTATNEDGFILYKLQPDRITWKEIARIDADTVPPPDVSAIDLTSKSGDCYQVTAYNKAGESPPSNTACLLTVPPGPINLSVSP